MVNADKALASFQFLGSAVKSLTYGSELINYQEASSGKKKLEIGFTVQQITNGGGSEPPKASPDANGFDLGVLDAKLSVKFYEDESRKACLSMKVVMQGAFLSDIPVTEEVMREFLETNGAAALYSVLRAYVKAFSALFLDEGDIVLPMLNMYKLNEEANAQVKIEQNAPEKTK